MSRYITTKADFTLRRKHKKGSGATIYENDYTTINPMPNALKGEYVIGDSNFIFTSRMGINAQKKHVRGKFVPNPMGEESAWTIDTIIDSGISEETRIRLKPNYTSIRDFACYGSAVKLVQGTVNGVITDFPAEMYLSNENITVYNGQEGVGYSFDEEKGVAFTGKVLFNEYGIDITTINVRPENVENPLRYFTLCGSSYTYIDTGDTTHDFIGFTVVNTASGPCYEGKSVWVDKLADVTLKFEGVSDVVISIYKDYKDESMFYTYTGGSAGGHIRPKKKIVEDYFRDCDDFTAVLLERNSRPLYMASFETPEETDTGIKYEMENYVWPSLNGGYNPDLSGPYFSYINSLIDLASFYDEYFTDNMWRSLTHEAIKTLDWTYVSSTEDDSEEMTKIDTSRIEPITKIYGRQFDDLKRYADGIKSINTITYNQKSNTPDYTLTDVLENSGWETKTLKITSDNDISTVSLYSGLTSGYTAGDANNEFLRRLKLNSQYLFSIKGTRKGLDTMLALFGFKPEEYDIHEYIYVASGVGNYTNFCNSTSNIPQNIKPKYPLAEDVSTINKYKINFDSYDPYGEYCGIPVAEIGYFSGDTNLSYVVPWFSYGKKYDDGLYFQKNGGWGRRGSMDINLEIAPDIKTITEWDVVPLYMETQARLKFAKDFDELLQQAFASSHKNDVFYVTDISRITDDYEAGFENEITDASHYFILENEDMNTFLGFNYEAETPKYGWRSVKTEEILEPNTAGTLVLYLESIEDKTDGNNPHIGNGTYDDGMAYVSGMSQIFNYSLLSRNFIGINDESCSAISKYVFDMARNEDNRKCWFFSDDYNTKYGKEAAYEKVTECGLQEKNIEFREVEVTEGICALAKCNDSKVNKATNCDGELEAGVDIINLLTHAGLNKTISIGKNAGKVYNRTSQLDTFDPETGKKGENGEAAANSIVNVKNIEVCFNLKQIVRTETEQTELRKYIEENVIPYLTQMIPSTSILFWKFDTDGTNPPSPVTPIPDIIMLTFKVLNGLTANTIAYTVNDGPVQILRNITEKTIKPFKNGDRIAWSATCSDSNYKDAKGIKTINGDTIIEITFTKKPVVEEHSVTFFISQESDKANGQLSYVCGTRHEENLPLSKLVPRKISGFKTGDIISYTGTSYGCKNEEGIVAIINRDETKYINFQEAQSQPCLTISPERVLLDSWSGKASFTAMYFDMCNQGQGTDVTRRSNCDWKVIPGDLGGFYEKGSFSGNNQYEETLSATVLCTYNQTTVSARTDIPPYVPPTPVHTPCLKMEPSEFFSLDSYSGNTNFIAKYFEDCEETTVFTDVTTNENTRWYPENSEFALIELGSLSGKNDSKQEQTVEVYAKYMDLETNHTSVTIPPKPQEYTSITFNVKRFKYGANVNLTGEANLQHTTVYSSSITITEDMETVTYDNIPIELVDSNSWSIGFVFYEAFPMLFFDKDGVKRGGDGNISLVVGNTLDTINNGTLKVYCHKQICATVINPYDKNTYGQTAKIKIQEIAGGNAKDFTYLNDYDYNETGKTLCTDYDVNTFRLSTSGWTDIETFGFGIENFTTTPDWTHCALHVTDKDGNEIFPQTGGHENDKADVAYFLGGGTGFAMTLEQLDGSKWEFGPEEQQ